ncbi:hypothetical protein SBOR_1099 [Sclerotinia borealis F-4128]|uniref:Uncharacterized protein n=1 Tax=Sclerotinia borealis (strain F-4128) TaxID=1432307 RepID=W9CNR8_SCLBF|nr:hypothetical protein SBOR_1099 [Sclerotinia borealis F-4128]
MARKRAKGDAPCKIKSNSTLTVEHGGKPNDIFTRYAGFTRNSDRWIPPTTRNQRQSSSSSSCSSSSTSPNKEESRPSEASDQATDTCGNTEAEPLRSGSRSAGKEIAKGSNYRIETEYLPSSATHASFGFDNWNHVVLTQLPEKIKDGIRTLLEKGWEPGIRREGICYDDERYFFKLNRRPFTSGNTYEVTRMVRNVIAYLASESWLVQPVPLLLSPYDTLNFRKCPKPLPKCYWLAITYGFAGRWHIRDQLCVLGGADELINTIRLTLREMKLVSKLKNEDYDSVKGWHQFPVKGSFLREGGWARKKIMLLRLMERLEERGWVIYVGYHRVYHANSDIEKKVGTWICVKSREWTSTNPVRISWNN